MTTRGGMRDSEFVMSKAAGRVFGIAVVLASVITLLSCGGTSAAPVNGANALGGVAIRITPQTMTVSTSSTQAFTATVANSNVSGVQWLVNGFPGGGGDVGTIDSSGNYTAPAYIPNPPTVTVTAVANADNTKSANAQVTITGAQLPAQVTISPISAYLQVGTILQLSASVQGPADTSVIWQVNGVGGGNSTVGTIAAGKNNTAVYTAPAKVPSPATVTITAASHAQPTHTASCSVTIFEQPPNIATVTITPTQATVEAGTFIPFSASVSGVTDTTVSWAVNNDIGGNSVDGTISSGTNNTATYTAPVKPPVPNTVTVTAVSHAQPSKSASATVTITPPPVNPVTIKVQGPSETSLCSIPQYMATVGNATDESVIWQVNGVTGGNATYGKIAPIAGNGNTANYTPPQQLPSPPDVVIGAIPNAAPNEAGTVDVSLTAPPITVSVTDTLNGLSTFQLAVTQTQQLQASVKNSCTLQTATWYVGQNGNYVEGGNSTLGTIVPDIGVNLVTYTAPASVPSNPTVTIKATADAAPSIFGTATATINATPVISVSITPSTNQTVQISGGNGNSDVFYHATVAGTTNTDVTWEVNGIPGGDNTCGCGIGVIGPDNTHPGDPTYAVYTAPAAVPNPSAVQVTAVSVPFPAVVSNADQVTITNPPPPPPSVSIDTLYAIIPGQTEPVNATPQNAGTNTTVDWSLSLPSGAPCTVATCGTISPTQTNNAPTTYTAPQSIPTDPYYVNITATLDAYPNVQATAQMEITANATPSISISPANPTIQAGSSGIITFTATVINAPQNTEVTWQMQCNSLAPKPNEWCFDFTGDGGGPGCLDVTAKECFENAQQGLPSVPAIYYPPGALGSNFQQNACATTQGSDGLVPIAATITVGGTNFTAETCITVTPP
jgi:hypothetical protein